jgi:hypothetical protein
MNPFIYSTLFLLIIFSEKLIKKDTAKIWYYRIALFLILLLIITFDLYTKNYRYSQTPPHFPTF